MENRYQVFDEKDIKVLYCIYCLFWFIVFLIFLHINEIYVSLANAQAAYNNFEGISAFCSSFQHPPYAQYPINPWEPSFFKAVPESGFFFSPYMISFHPIQMQSLMPNSISIFPIPFFFNLYETFFPKDFNNVLFVNLLCPFYNPFQYPAYQYPFVPKVIPFTGNLPPNLSPSQDISPYISPFPRPKNSYEYPIPEDIPQERKMTLKRALDWIFDNTTDLRYTTATEIGEEIFIFYQLYLRVQSKEAKDFCKGFINFRIKQIVESGKLNNPTPGEATIFLNMCEIMLQLGPSLFDYGSFINQKVLTNFEIFNPGYDIWNVSILERLGFNPLAPLVSLIPNCSIVKEFQSGNLIRLIDSPGTDIFLIRERFSDIIHEIFPLTNFGETPIMMITPDQITFLKYLIDKGIIYFIQAPDLDMVGELLISANMIDMNDQSLLDLAYQFVIDNQIPDGSFGEILGFILIGRSSTTRHTVYVAVWAMIQ